MDGSSRPGDSEHPFLSLQRRPSERPAGRDDPDGCRDHQGEVGRTRRILRGSTNKDLRDSDWASKEVFLERSKKKKGRTTIVFFENDMT